VNAIDNFYWTPLHMAAHSGVRAVVEYLLEHGASLEATSLTGATPIMKAIESCSLDVVQLLINRGAKVRTEDMCSKSTHARRWRLGAVVASLVASTKLFHVEPG